MPASSAQEEEYDSDYLTRLLLADAKSTSSRFSRAARPANAIKPNTRFLQNVVRGVSLHNRTLARKEEREKVERLRSSPARGPRDDRRRERERRERDKHERRDERRPTQDQDTQSNSDNDREGRSRTRRRTSPDRIDREFDQDRRVHRHKQRRGSSSDDRQLPSSHTDSQAALKTKPDADVDSDSDEWRMALAALRDRARYRSSKVSGTLHKSGHRARASRDLDADGRDQDPGGLRWSRAGVTREWDVGKAQT